MMDSLSSSSSVSQLRMISSRRFFTSGEKVNCSITFSSRSKSLMENHRAESRGTTSRTVSEMAARACSTVSEKACWGTAFCLAWASSAAFWAASRQPSPFTAAVSTTGQPRAAESLAVSILSPFFLTTSIMLRAITTG